MYRNLSPALLVLLLIIASSSHALTIVGGPSFTPAPNAPLAGVLALTTDSDSRVSVSLNDGTRTWVRNFYDFGTAHTIPLLGFKPGRTNQITVSVLDKYRNQATASSPLVFVTAPLPSDFPPSMLLKNEPDKMEPGFTLFRILNQNDNQAYVTIIDNSADVVWYGAVPTTSDVRQLTNGDLFIPLTSTFTEVNLLGQTVRTWPVPNNLAINLHDGVPTPQGTILYLNDASRVLTNFPTSDTDPTAPTQTTSVLYNRVVEISVTNSSLLNLWSPIDVLDPRRLTYLTFDIHSALGWDIEHANAVIEDPRDNTLIVSMRQQNAVIKFYRDTGQLKWILGPHENWGPEFQQYLLTPVGSPFEWQYGQHAPTITPQGTLLVYDDGNYRAMPFDPPVANTNNYSRAVEYQINEQTMEVSQVWDYGRTNAGDRIFTDRVGNADWLPKTRNVLIDFGYVIDVNGAPPSPTAPAASELRIQEVTHDPVPEVVFDLVFFDFSNSSPNYRGCFAYRCHRIADLYAHPAQPVADLALTYQDGIPQLTFSADETRSYSVQASRDLVQWQTVGEASQQDVVGNWVFEDTEGGSSDTRYYRVISQ